MSNRYREQEFVFGNINTIIALITHIQILQTKKTIRYKENIMHNEHSNSYTSQYLFESTKTSIYTTKKYILKANIIKEISKLQR